MLRGSRVWRVPEPLPPPRVGALAPVAHRQQGRQLGVLPSDEGGVCLAGQPEHAPVHALPVPLLQQQEVEQHLVRECGEEGAWGWQCRCVGRRAGGQGRPVMCKHLCLARLTPRAAPRASQSQAEPQHMPRARVYLRSVAAVRFPGLDLQRGDHALLLSARRPGVRLSARSMSPSVLRCRSASQTQALCTARGLSTPTHSLPCKLACLWTRASGRPPTWVTMAPGCPGVNRVSCTVASIMPLIPYFGAHTASSMSTTPCGGSGRKRGKVVGVGGWKREHLLEFAFPPTQASEGAPGRHSWHHTPIHSQIRTSLAGTPAGWSSRTLQRAGTQARERPGGSASSTCAESG